MTLVQKLHLWTCLMFSTLVSIGQSTEFSSTCLDKNVDFATAVDLCKAEGKELVSIRNEEENRALGMLLKSDNCMSSADHPKRMWIKYNHWQSPKVWLESRYPLIFTDWTKRTSTKCALMTAAGWQESRCSEHATNLLFCENRDDEESGRYGVILRKDSTLSTIRGVLPSNRGLIVKFSARSTTALMMKVVDNTLTLQCYNYREVQTSGLVERIIMAGPAETVMTHTRYLTNTTSGPISLQSEMRLKFYAKSDCVLYNVRIYDTARTEETTGTTIALGWASFNWLIEGAYYYFTTESIKSSFYCKEGTYRITSRHCKECPVGTYQNLRNMDSCNECPANLNSSIALTACICPIKGGCNDKESMNDQQTDTSISVVEEEENTTSIVETDSDQEEKDPTTESAGEQEEKTVEDETGHSNSSNHQDNLITNSTVSSLTENSTSRTTEERITATKSPVIGDFCEPQIVEDPLFGNYDWARATVFSVITQLCYYRSKDDYVSMATRKCTKNDNDMIVWDRPDFSQCKTKSDHDISEISHMEITEENAADVSDMLVSSTSDINQITRYGIDSAVSTMESLSLYTDSGNAEAFINIGSNLLDASSDDLSHSKESLKEILSDMAAKIAKEGGQNKILTKNVDIVTTETRESGSTELETSDTSVSVPHSLASLTSGIYATVFKNSKLFRPGLNDEEMAVITDFNFNDMELKDSASEIILAFNDTMHWITNDSYFVKCVFWDGDDWNTEGCRYDAEDRACYCNHATPFTSILSFRSSNHSTESEDQKEVLYTEIVCLSISILSCLTLMTLIMSIRGLRVLQSFKLHCNLAAALLVQFSAFLVLDLTSPKGIWCSVVGVIAHWATLSAFLSMMTEAISVYYAIVVVFDSHIRYVAIKVVAICYGIPFLLVGIFAAVTETSHYKCHSGGFLTTPYKSFLMDIPILLIVLINTIIFIIITYKTIKLRLERCDETFSRIHAVSQLKMTFTLNTLLGLGFLLGLVTDFSIILQMVFIFVNALSGFFLLCLFGIFNPMARDAMKKTLRITKATNASSLFSYKLTKQSDPD